MSLSENERKFIVDGVLQNLRTDGRGRFDFRPFSVKTDVTPQAHGSAQVRVDGTEVIANIRADLGEPSREQPALGRLICNVVCTSIAAPEFERDNARNLNVRLTRALEEMLLASGCVDLQAMGLIPGKSCWILQIEVQALDYAGNLFDTVCLAVKAALLTCRIPKVEVVRCGDAENPDEREIRLVEPATAASPSGEENELDKEFLGLTLASGAGGSVVGTAVYQPLPLGEVPTCVTLTKIGECFVVDPTLEEEACMDAQCCIGVVPVASAADDAEAAQAPAMRICHISKRGAGGLAASTMEQMVQVAEQLGSTLHQRLYESLLEEAGALDGDEDDEEDGDF